MVLRAFGFLQGARQEAFKILLIGGDVTSTLSTRLLKTRKTEARVQSVQRTAEPSFAHKILAGSTQSSNIRPALQRCASTNLCSNNTQNRVEKSLTALEDSTLPEKRGAFFAGLPSSERALSEGRNPKAAPAAMGSSSDSRNCTHVVSKSGLGCQICRMPS
jgi:hypothetical protein